MTPPAVKARWRSWSPDGTAHVTVSRNALRTLCGLRVLEDRYLHPTRSYCEPCAAAAAEVGAR